MYNLLEEENPKVLVTKATSDAKFSSEAYYFEVACSFLHIIVVRHKIFPYTNMVRWIINNMDISDRTFINSRHEVIWSFKLEKLLRMYHLPEPQKLYDKAFIE